MDEAKHDPVGPEYFNPLLRADRAATCLFLGSAALSIIVVLVDKSSQPSLHAVGHVAFVLSVISLFVVNLAIRLYFFPRAQTARYRDFLGHAYRKDTSHQKTSAYYNNAAGTAPGRVAAQVLESVFFTKRILSHMAGVERSAVAGYALVWLTAVLYRGTGLDLIAVAAQIVFSEQLLSRWLRFEYFRSEAEKIYEELFRLHQQSRAKIEMHAIELLGRYEMLKATTALSLSTRIFHREREGIGAEWDKIRATLKI